MALCILYTTHITFELLHNLTHSSPYHLKTKKKAEMKFDVLVSFSEHSSCEAQYLEDKKVVKID